jgi:hypothetical protein
MDLKRYLPNKKAFTALLVGGILALMIGAVLLIVSYTVLNAVVTSAGTVSNAALNTSMFSNFSNITAALNISGISLIIIGISTIIYMLVGLGSIGAQR